VSIYDDRPTSMYDVRHPQGEQVTLDAGRLWAGGIATALVAGLVALVGMLLARVVFNAAAYAPSTAGALGDRSTIALCVLAAIAGLAATGLVQLLVVATPQPMTYFGWIAGLGTAAAVLVPMLIDGINGATISESVIHLVIGIAIGTLVAGSASAAIRRG
jgi:Family of unknown function (DUF6069)